MENATSETKNNDQKDSTIKRIELPPVPEGMSKNQWKKIWKRKQWELNKEEYRQKRKMKRQRVKENRQRLIQSYVERGEEIPSDYIREPKVNVNQVDSGMKLIIDCSFDELMNDREIVSLSTQLTRAYAANKRANKYSEIKIIGFNKRLKERFENGLSNSNHKNWNHFKFIEEPIEGQEQEQEKEQRKEKENENENDNENKNEGLMTSDEYLRQLDPKRTVYLTADTEEELETLEADMTYIIGGIVDKNRYKDLCLNRAKQFGIPTKKLPIDKYIKLNGRQVLTTAHVVQLMLSYADTRNWAKSMETVLPQRKIDLIGTLNKQEMEGTAEE